MRRERAEGEEREREKVEGEEKDFGWNYFRPENREK
jgi:hypothetical protein